MNPFPRHPLRWALVLVPFAGLSLLPNSSEADDASAGLPKAETARHKSFAETIPGAQAKFDMIAVPGGTFLMGSPATEKDRGGNEGPRRAVTVRPFWIGKCEVTWDEYDPFAVTNPGNKQDQMDAEKKKADQKTVDALSRPTPPYADPTFGYGHDGQPVVSVTHHAAMEYCHWLSEKTGKTYRLPTEAEWEWACRAGTTTPYSFGDDDGKVGEYAWFAGNSEESPHKVGQKKPNLWGLHDMHGNVAEWCLDQYRKDFYATLPLNAAALMPVNLPTGDRYAHVARGGSWADKESGVRSAVRRGSEKSWNKQDPQVPKSLWWLTDADFVGFRVVCPVEDAPPLKGFRSKIKWDSK